MANSGGLLSNLAWKFGERVSSQLVTLVVSILLARLLDPKDYGAVAIVLAFVTLAYVLVEGGFSNALIQKKNADALDFSTVFYFSLAFAIVIYIVIFFAAPLISRFYGEGYEILTPVMRVLGLQVIVYSMNSVQQAYVSKNMMFRNFFYATLWGTIISGAVGLAMAYLGYGIWALVGQHLSASIIGMLALYIATKKLPLFAFSWTRLHGLLKYGINLLGASFLVTLYSEIRSLIIGKLYSSSDLAFFEKGKSFPNLVVANVNSSIGAVLFPKISLQQDDISQVKATTRNSIRFSSYVMSPLMLGLAAVADPFIRLLLTDKWAPCIPLMQILCAGYIFQPIHTANMQAIKALGKSNVFLYLEIIKKSIELVTLLVVMWLGVPAIVISMTVLNFLFTFINAYPNIKLMDYSIREQISDIFPNFIMAFTMAVITYLITLLPLSNAPMLVIQIITGAMVYWGLSVLTKNRQYVFIKNLIMDKINNIRNK